MDTPIKLEDCKLITNQEYALLKEPKFKGQTHLDKDNMYYMIWESEGVLYKTHNKL
jgi:hypothetical protein